jgi:O-antigen ligase
VAGRAARPAERFLRDNWFAICALTLLVATDYKVRVRDVSSSVGGVADVQIYLEILLYAAVGTYLLFVHGRPPRLRRIPMPLFLLCAYVTVMATSLLETLYLSLAVVRLTEMTIVLALVAAVVADGTRADLHRFAHGFVVLVAISVGIGLVLPMPRYSLQEDRFTWLRLHPVTAGVYVGLATVICIAYLLSGRQDRPGPRWPVWVYVGLLVVDGGGLIGTKTRGAVVGTLVALAILVVLSRRGRARLQLIGMVILAVLAFVLASLGSITSYFVRGETAQSLATLNSRTDLWSLAWTDIKQKPMYGWGLEASRGIFLDSIGLGGGHNAVVNVAVDLGAVGLLVWVALLCGTAATIARSRSQAAGRPIDRALLLAFLGFLISDGMFFEGLGATSNIASIMLFILAGWSVLLRRDDQRDIRTRRAGPLKGN